MTAKNTHFPRISSLLVLTAFVPLLGAASSATGPSSKVPDPDAPPTKVDPVIAKLIELHNAEREREGSPPLKGNAKLEAAARSHAKDMASHEKMDHKGSDDSTPEQRIDKAGYQGNRTGENIAYGQPTPEAAMKTWMNSPHHKENILGKYTEIGAAVAESEKGTPYWCVNFGDPFLQFEPAEAASRLIAALNKERKEAKLAPLKANDKLQAAAQRHAKDLAGRVGREPDPNKKDANDGERDDDGLTPLERVKKLGYKYLKVGQTAAFGQPTPEEALKTWLEGPQHKASLLGDFTEVGAGYASAKDGTPYWCLVLAVPMK